MQWLDMKEWLEDSEKKWDACHKETYNEGWAYRIWPRRLLLEQVQGRENQNYRTNVACMGEDMQALHSENVNKTQSSSSGMQNQS
jgi:hypothetical protein